MFVRVAGNSTWLQETTFHLLVIRQKCHELCICLPWCHWNKLYISIKESNHHSTTHLIGNNLGTESGNDAPGTVSSNPDIRSFDPLAHQTVLRN